MMMFSCQAESSAVKFSHTFATFVKAMRESASSKNHEIEVHTISWMPGTLDITILRWEPERGRNLDLPSTLRWAESGNARVSLWGPYEIEKELYVHAVAQESRLESGSIGYKAVDAAFRPNALNCIHAVSDLNTEEGLIHVGLERGDSASSLVANHLKRWIIGLPQTYPWVAERAGLKDYPVTVRNIE
ncbi:MAG TPA: hypothetical protein VG759_02385 [Candidatus Angelobacter sp.]|jgi:hypothetical protein|nr:hypothetical protein [Candidatus Angelobacter sp.]